MNYREAREFINQTTKFGSILGLTSMRALMEELGNVQNTIPTIHIGGTNGKGSVGAYLASLCKEAGLKVGRYCSPAVFDPLECWQYDGNNITEEEYASCMSQVKCACDIVISKGIQPTVFEVETAMAFVYFAKKKPDVLLLEVGLGGETDATNVVDNPLACVFTTISFDHMQFLGETLGEIAAVKSGIMKPGAKVFWGEQVRSVEEVLTGKFTEICELEKKLLEDDVLEDINATSGVLEDNGLKEKYDGIQESENIRKFRTQLVKVDYKSTSLISEEPGKLIFSYDGETYTTKMAGHYQMKNAVLAITVFKSLWPGKESYIAEGIKNAAWPGRFEVLGENPLFIIDGAHNEDAAKQLRITLENCFTNQPLTYIIGVLADKEHKKMLEIMLPKADKVFTITPQNARGMDGKLLLQEAKEVCKEQNLSIDMEFCSSIGEALHKTRAYAIAHKQPVLSFGSLSYLGSLREEYQHICESRNEND